MNVTRVETVFSTHRKGIVMKVESLSHTTKPVPGGGRALLNLSKGGLAINKPTLMEKLKQLLGLFGQAVGLLAQVLTLYKKFHQ
jgi:hypothetical protein